MKLVRRLLLVAAVAVTTLGGCAVSYIPGLEKGLTEPEWKAQGRERAVVVISGDARSIWSRTDSSGYRFELLPHYSSPGGRYDVAFIDPGSYELSSVLTFNNQQANLFGFGEGLGQSTAAIARFAVAPGDVVYLGHLDAQIMKQAVDTCAAFFYLSLQSAQVLPAVGKQFPYLQIEPRVAPLDLMRKQLVFPGPCN